MKVIHSFLVKPELSILPLSLCLHCKQITLKCSDMPLQKPKMQFLLDELNHYFKEKT